MATPSQIITTSPGGSGLKPEVTPSIPSITDVTPSPSQTAHSIQEKAPRPPVHQSIGIQHPKPNRLWQK